MRELTTNELAMDLLSGAAFGLPVGIFFFGALWWTVRRLHSTRHPHLLLFGSFLARAAVVVGVFYWLATDGPWAVLGAALGFLLSRSVLVRALGPMRRTPSTAGRTVR